MHRKHVGFIIVAVLGAAACGNVYQPDLDGTIHCPQGCYVDGVCYADGEADPANPCHVCDPAQAPQAWTGLDGMECDDGRFCTVGDTCVGGVCMGEARDCSDGLSCNGAETCDASADACVEGPSPCAPTEFCDVVADECQERCPGCRVEGICYGDGQVNPASPCLVCDAAVSRTAWSDHDGAACDDGLFCTTGDVCQGGTCDGTPLSCDDGVACNGTESCDEDADACIEGVSTCSGTEICDVLSDTCRGWCPGCVVGGVCWGDGQVNPANPCQICDVQAAVFAWSDHDGSPCDDGLFCTTGDVCQGGTCDGTPLSCDDGVACNGTESCDENADTCVPGTTPCGADELCDVPSDRCVTRCTGCVIAGSCYGQGQVNPANPCQICEPARSDTAWSDHDGATCDDGQFCTVDDTCAGGACTGTARDCSDGVECNGVETCDESADACVPESRPHCEASALCVDACDQLGAGLPYFVASATPSRSTTAGGVTWTLVGSFGDGSGATLEDLADALQLTPVSYAPDQVVLTTPPGALDREITFTASGGTPVPYLEPTVVSGQRAFLQRATVPLGYLAPTVTAVSGCTVDGNVTRDCDFNGGLTLVVSGTDFGDDPAAITVDVDGTACTVTDLIQPHQELTCLLDARPTGGWDLPLTVTVGGRSGTLSGAVSFSGPVVDDFVDVVGASPAGGQSLTLTGTGFGGGSVAVTYGPTGVEFSCAVTSVTDTEIQCILDAGIGMGYPVHVQVGQQQARPTTSTISYAQPSLVAGSLRDADLGTGSATLSLTALPTRVWFDVDDVGPDLSLLTVIYTDGTGEQECLDPVLSTASGTLSLGCVVWTNLSTDDVPLGPSTFEIRVPGGASDPGPDTLDYPSACPTLTGLSGCVDAAPTTGECTTEGGVTITAQGTGLTAATEVLVDGMAAAGYPVSATAWAFTLPPGVGTAQVTLREHGCSSAPLTLGYAAPAVTRVEGCPEQYGDTTNDCPTGGNIIIYVSGENFGPSGAAILVGGLPCTNVYAPTGDPHHRLACTLGPGTGVDLPVVVINGRVSTQTGTLSYAVP